jgi:hypothetical protein
MNTLYVWDDKLRVHRNVAKHSELVKNQNFTSHCSVRMIQTHVEKRDKLKTCTPFRSWPTLIIIKYFLWDFVYLVGLDFHFSLTQMWQRRNENLFLVLAVNYETRLLHSYVAHPSEIRWKSHFNEAGVAQSEDYDDRSVWLDSRQVEGIFLFSAASRSTLGATWSPIQWLHGALCLG